MLTIDLSALPAAMREVEAHRLVKAEAQRPFDLRRTWPWRAALVRLSEQEHVLIVTQHHISLDGWSITVRNNELAVLYTAFVEGRPSPLPELPVQHADFAH